MGTPLLTGVTPTSIGLYKFVTPGVCATATQPSRIISSTGVDGLQAQSISLKDITNISGVYSGTFSVVAKSMKKVAGPDTLMIDIPVGVTVAPAAPGQVNFVSCSTVTSPTDSTPIIVKNKWNTQDIDFSGRFGGGGGVGPASSECPGDTFLCGIQGQTTASVQRIYSLCRNDSSSLVARGPEIGGGASGGLVGPYYCPTGMWANGVSVNGAAGVNRVTLQCQDPVTALTGTALGMGGGGVHFQGRFMCQPNYYIFRIMIYGGDVLDSIQFVCAKYTP